MRGRDERHWPDRDFMYMPDTLWRLSWPKFEAAPPPYAGNYYLVTHRGRHVGELFMGKSGRWYAVVFGRMTFSGRNVRTVEDAVVGMVTEPRT